jgi:hypothetical protein
MRKKEFYTEEQSVDEEKYIIYAFPSQEFSYENISKLFMMDFTIILLKTSIRCFSSFT